MQQSDAIAQWSNSNPLQPWTNCNGTPAGTETCPNELPTYTKTACSVLAANNIRTTYSVAGATSSANGVQLITSIGTVQLLRPSGGGVWRTYTTSLSVRVGVDLNLNTVAFGYMVGGSFFSTIMPDGTVRSVGYNPYGQLGNGTFTSTTVPTSFTLNGTDKAVALFTNFASIGWDMFAITDQGTVWGAGLNTSGQLGNNSTTNQSTPVQFALPGGEAAKYVGVLGYTTYVITTSGNVYAAGNCSNGMLGSNYTIASCSNALTYVRVALPTVSGVDANTQPTTNIALDRNTVYLRMAGGRVYAWGDGDTGQLANGGTANVSAPIQVGTYGNTGQPRATQVAFDGDTVYVVDDGGNIQVSGKDTYGELAGDKIPIFNIGANGCLDNKTSDGITMQYHACNGTSAQQYQFRSDSSIYNPSTGKCLNNPNLDGTTVQISTCNGAVSQQFVMRDDNTIYFPNKNECLNNPNLDGVTIQWSACNASTSQQFSLPSVSTLTNFALPSGAGNAVKVWTDQWFATVLTDTGQVWSAGLNNKGQLGNGSIALHQPYPVQFILPSGVTAVDIYNTSVLPTSAGGISDTFVIGSDGKVYGAGSNGTGQLGDGTTTDQSTPVAMLGIDGVSVKAQQVQSGYGTTVVLTTGKKIYTVGNNANGQLGDGTTTNNSTPHANRFTNVLPTTLF